MALIKEAASSNGHKKTVGIEVPKRLSTIPEPSIAEKYVGRQVLGGAQDFDLFDLAFNKGWNVLLEGDTGSGKTLATRAYASARGKHFYSTPNNVGIDPSQLFGKYIPDETGKGLATWQDGPVTDMGKYGGVLLLNELNFLPPRVATALFSLLDDRREFANLDHRGEVIRVHRPNCWCDLPANECKTMWLLIVADMNPGYAGTSDLNQALRNRFPIQLNWDYDLKVERTLVQSSVLLDFAAKVRKQRKDGELVTPTSTNMLTDFEEMERELGLKAAMINLVQHYDEEDRAAVQTALQTMESNLITSYDKIRAAKNTKKEEPAKKASSGWEEIESEVFDWSKQG